MKRLLTLTLILSLALLATACGDKAEDEAATESQAPLQDQAVPGDPVISQQELDRFMADYPTYITWAQSQGAQQPPIEEIEAYVRDLGWDSERFGYVLNQVVIGAMALQLEDQMQEIKDQTEQIKAQRDQLMASANLTEDQKSQMQAQVEQILQSREQMIQAVEAVPDENVALVAANIDKLNTVMQSGMPTPPPAPEAQPGQGEAPAAQDAQ